MTLKLRLLGAEVEVPIDAGAADRCEGRLPPSEVGTAE